MAVFFVTYQEGGVWNPTKFPGGVSYVKYLIDSYEGGLLQLKFFAVKFPDGRIWDKSVGWRPALAPRQLFSSLSSEDRKNLLNTLRGTRPNLIVMDDPEDDSKKDEDFHKRMEELWHKYMRHISEFEADLGDAQELDEEDANKLIIKIRRK